MSVLTGKALHEQLSVIMAALTKAAVVEICELVDEGFAVLQMEITRSHKENQDLKKKLHLIESIVIRGSCGGKEADVPEPDTPQQQRDDGGGDGAAALGLREEVNTHPAWRQAAPIPDVVLIKDEDSNDPFERGETAPADSGTAATREGVALKRHWLGSEEAEKKSSSELSLTSPKATKKSVSVYALDSPQSEPGRSAQVDEMESAESVCSYASQVDPDVQLVHQECSLLPPTGSRPLYFENSSVIGSQSSTNCHVAFTQFQEGVDGDAFGLKMICVSGSASTDCPPSESSNSAFECEQGSMMNFYRDHLGPSKCSGGARRGKRFVCSLCSKTYATSQSLDVHMRIHTGERPFSCNQCGKKFTQSAHLKSHLSIHSGERPYICRLCSKSFIVKYSLKLHMIKCHPNIRAASDDG